MVKQAVQHHMAKPQACVAAVIASMIWLCLSCACLPNVALAAGAEGGKTALQAQELTAQAVDYDTSWYTGASPYTIKNVKQLKGLAYLVNSGTHDFAGETVTLPDSALFSLAFSGTSIEPIGTQDHPFNGTFDGKSRPIVNLTLNVGDLMSNIGLFGYAGDAAQINNVVLQGGSVTVLNEKNGERISNVGAIAGYLGGNMANCSSTASVTVTNNGAVPNTTGSTPEELCTILYVGGLVGHLGGNMTSCAHRDSRISINSTSDITEGVPFVAGFVGGLVGYQGNDADAMTAPVADKCANTGDIAFDVSGSGGKDRFGAQMYSKSSMVGGIVGYTMGSVTNSSNSASINTGIVRDGVTQAGWGATNVGGIVGSMRGPTIAEAASATGIVGSDNTDPGHTVWIKSNGATAPPSLSIKMCSNTGAVTGLASVGGICGSGGAFTEIEGCSNTALIEGTRWNKPCPAGIVGIMNGDIKYCYNQGRCFSTTGGGYYASGIAALLTTYNNSTTTDETRLDMPEMYGCYVTGTIGGSSAGYRTAVLAGENDGFIHDNCFLPDLTVDKVVDKETFGDDKYHSRLVTDGEDRGIVKNNHEVSATDMRTTLAVAYLNQVDSSNNDWALYYVPVTSKYPQLSWQTSIADSARTDINTIVKTAQLGARPRYSSTKEPVPSIKLEARDGSILYQGADFKVVPQSGALSVDAGTPYEATIEGINRYKGTLAVKVKYGIDKESIASCTVTASPRVFNWEKQEPAEVVVRDSAGAVVDADEYTWRTLANDDGDPSRVNGKYYDYINTHGKTYRYDIEVTATEASECYTGTTVQAAFQISWASLMYNPKGDDIEHRDETAKYDKIIWEDQEWDYSKALDTKGFVKIKYTGQPIKPTIANPTYLGRPLRNGTGMPYYNFPLDYDYRYIYGNPNPEDGADKSTECIDATGSDEADLTCMTIRFTSGGNFDNYTNIFFEITPASVESDVAVSGVNELYPYTGSAVKPVPTLTYNGMTLKEGVDYTLAYGENIQKGDATGTITISGLGNYDGARTISFGIKDSIEGATVSGINGSYPFNGSAVTPVPTVTLGGRVLSEGTDYTVSYEDNDRAGNAKVVITGQNSFAGQLTKDFAITAVDLASDAISVRSATSYPYNAGSVEPDFEVVFGDVVLSRDADYTISYANNTSVGQGRATLTGMGSYSGTRTVDFEIVKGSIVDDVQISGIDEAYPFTGEAIYPVPVLACQSNSLVMGRDYSVTYGDNVQVSTGGTVTVQGQGSFVGSLTLEFSIKPSIAKAVLGGIAETYEFNGTAVTPKPTVTLDGTELVEDVDYELAYEANDAVGSALLVVRGKGTYAGSASKAFAITQADFENAAPTLENLAEVYAFNGGAVKPEPKVSFNGVELVKGADYTVSYAGNTKVGDATITITGQGNYTGQLTRLFAIKKGSIKTDVEVVLSDSYAYAGSAVTPKPIVTCEGNVLIEGRHYSLSYADNDAVGTGKVTVSGIDGFEDAKTFTFGISKADIGSVAQVTGIDEVYMSTGSALTPKPSVRAFGSTLIEGTDYTVSYGENTEVGIGSVVISGMGNYAGDKSYLFMIHGHMSEAVISGLASRVYTGAPQTQNVTVKLNGKPLVKGVDFDVSYKNNVKAGTATVLVTGKGNYSGSKVATFAIGKAKASQFTVKKIKKQKYKRGKAVKPAPKVYFKGVKLKKNVDYKVSYKKNKKRGTAKVIIKGIGNFTGSKTVKFKIK